MMRATTEMDEDLKLDIDELRKERRWSFSKMCYELLKNAVAEKKRLKRKNEGKNTAKPDMEG